MKVGVKFCGNCNPHIDTVSLYKQLAAEMNDIEFVYHGEGDYNLLLVLSGCEVDCAARPDRKNTEVVVAGATVNRLPVSREHLLEEVKLHLRKSLAEVEMGGDVQNEQR